MNAQDSAAVATFLASRAVKVCPTRIVTGSRQLRKGRDRRFLEA